MKKAAKILSILHFIWLGIFVKAVISGDDDKVGGIKREYEIGGSSSAQSESKRQQISTGSGSEVPSSFLAMESSPTVPQPQPQKQDGDIKMEEAIGVPDSANLAPVNEAAGQRRGTGREEILTRSRGREAAHQMAAPMESGQQQATAGVRNVRIDRGKGKMGLESSGGAHHEGGEGGHRQQQQGEAGSGMKMEDFVRSMSADMATAFGPRTAGAGGSGTARTMKMETDLDEFNIADPTLSGGSTGGSAGGSAGRSAGTQEQMSGVPREIHGSQTRNVKIEEPSVANIGIMSPEMMSPKTEERYKFIPFLPVDSPPPIEPGRGVSPPHFSTDDPPQQQTAAGPSTSGAAFSAQFEQQEAGPSTQASMEIVSATESQVSGLKNWLQTNLDSFKRLKDENIMNSKNVDILLQMADTAGNIATGQIPQALFNLVKGKFENKEREKLVKQMEELNDEFKESYYTLKLELEEAIGRIDQNQANKSGYFNKVICILDLLQPFYDEVLLVLKKNTMPESVEAKKERIIVTKAIERQCGPTNLALKALRRIRTYVNDSLMPANYSVYFLDHRFKKKELVRIVQKIRLQAKQLYMISTFCASINSPMPVEIRIINQTYNEIKVLLVKWVNQALDLAWPAVFKEKVIPAAVNSILENEDRATVELDLIAQKIVEEANQYGRECFKYQVLVVKKDHCKWEKKSCPKIQLPRYSRLDPDESVDIAPGTGTKKVKTENEASASSSSIGGRSGGIPGNNIEKKRICIYKEHNGFRIVLSRMFIPDNDVTVPSHSRIKYLETTVKDLITKQNDSKLLENVQKDLPQKVTGGVWMTSGHQEQRVKKCVIGFAAEAGGATDYGLERYDISNQGRIFHFYVFNPRIPYHEFALYKPKIDFRINMQQGIETISIYADLLPTAESYTVNFWNKEGIMLSHFHEIAQLQQIEVRQFGDKANLWKKTNRSVHAFSNTRFSWFVLESERRLNLHFEIQPQKILVRIGNHLAYTFHRQMLAPIERVVIAGDLRLLQVDQINQKTPQHPKETRNIYNYVDAKYGKRNFNEMERRGDFLALTMGPSGD